MPDIQRISAQVRKGLPLLKNAVTILDYFVNWHYNDSIGDEKRC